LKKKIYSCKKLAQALQELERHLVRHLPRDEQRKKIYQNSKQCSKILVRIRTYLCLLDPDPAIFVSDLFGHLPPGKADTPDHLTDQNQCGFIHDPDLHPQHC
jgi:hypothetical protein